MVRLVIDGYGKSVGKKKNRIVVRDEGSTVAQVSVRNLEQVIISGKGAVSFDALRLLGASGIPLIVLDWRGDVVSKFVGSEVGTVNTRKEQYFASVDDRGLLLAREFVWAKMRNQYAVLGTLAKSRGRSGRSVEALLEARDRLKEFLRDFDDEAFSSRDLLFGLEGYASSIYWEAVASIVPGEFGFTGRSGRHAGDPVNACLNYGYGVLMGEVMQAVHVVGLDPFGGFLHSDRSGRVGLVLDLMEEFRQQVVDKVVFGLFGRRVIGVGDFVLDGGLCRIGDGSRRVLVGEVLGKLGESVMFEGVRRSYRDLVISQARKIVRFLRGEVSTYSGFYLRW